MAETNLDIVRPNLDLAPRHSFIRPRPGVASIVLLAGVDVDGVLRPVPHEAGIRDVVLHHASPEDDHPRALRPHRDGVDRSDVLDDVYGECLRRRLERVEVEHVPKAAVRQGRAEDGDVVLVRPVVDGPLVVDLLAQAVDDLGRGPLHRLLVVLGRLLLLEHLVQDGDDPVLEGAVVGIGHDQVADPVESLAAETGAVGAEGPHVRVAEAFYKVLLDAAGGRDDARDVLVLHEPPENAPQPRGDEVRRVAEEDGGLVTSLGIPPVSLHHLCG